MNTEDQSPEQPDDEGGDVDISDVLEYAKKTERHYREDVRELDTYIMKVAGLGATVGGYLLVAGELVSSAVARWSMVSAVTACILAGISTGFSLLFARRRAEAVLPELDEIRDEAIVKDAVENIEARLENVNAASRRHDGLIHVFNGAAAVLALAGLAAFITAAFFAAAATEDEQGLGNQSVTVEGDGATINVYNTRKDSNP